MNRDNFSRAIPVVLIVIIVVIAIAAIVSVGRSIFGGGDDTTNNGPTEIERGRKALVSTDVTRAVRLTERGPIVADENFRSYQITVTPTSRSITIFEGYLENVIETRTYSNNTPAYEEFVHALDNAGMMHGAVLTGDKDDNRGICASDHLYEYEVLQAERTVKRLWTSDCRDTDGSLAKDARARTINNLFKAQIPDSRELIRKLGN